jgi:predicted ABC-type transport system involved in lysophospholipase L1 biosynthesis ATPase subunit
VTLEDFKSAGRGLITNARCLTEGVDVPSVDMVAFVDPRKSKIDIAQAAGRAMRQSKATNKKLGYIVVPLFIEQKKNETEAEAKRLLDYLGLSERINHKPSQLSGGEQQRVAVARALINKPAIIFADEPSGNLDTVSAENLHQLFFKLRDEFGQTFVIVTHNEDLANMADRKLIMSDGNII